MLRTAEQSNEHIPAETADTRMRNPRFVGPEALCKLPGGMSVWYMLVIWPSPGEYSLPLYRK